jgi:hypothetical protein
MDLPQEEYALLFLPLLLLHLVLPRDLEVTFIGSAAMHYAWVWLLPQHRRIARFCNFLSTTGMIIGMNHSADLLSLLERIGWGVARKKEQSE